MTKRKRPRRAAGKDSKSDLNPEATIKPPTADQIFWAGVRAMTNAENEAANSRRAAKRDAEQRDHKTPDTGE